MKNKKLSDLLAAVERLQEVQKRNHPKSKEWQWASRGLAPIFEELARRQRGQTEKADNQADIAAVNKRQSERMRWMTRCEEEGLPLCTTEAAYLEERAATRNAREA